jgi:hypothetical protein
MVRTRRPAGRSLKTRASTAMKHPASPRLLKESILAGALVLLAGCSTTSTYTVQIDAITAPDKATAQGTALPQSFHIRSKNPKLDESSLRYKEVSDYVKTALSGRGMYEAPTAELADVVIDIDYGMDAPRVKFQTMSKPMILQTGGDTKTETVERIVQDPNGNAVIVTQKMEVYVPGSTEVVGVQEEVTPVIVYEKYLKVSARENKEAVEGRAPPEVWSVNVSAEDMSQELRKYIPILASASADYIGTNTKESKPVKVGENDEAVKFVKKGM